MQRQLRLFLVPGGAVSFVSGDAEILMLTSRILMSRIGQRLVCYSEEKGRCVGGEKVLQPRAKYVVGYWVALIQTALDSGFSVEN